MGRLKVFIDTNVWFSAIYGSVNCREIINKHIQKDISAFISQNVLDELIKNITNKIPNTFLILKNIFENAPPTIVKSSVTIDKKVTEYVDFKDQHIFQSAVDSKCDFFVTGNLKDFNVKKLEKIYKIKIVTPSEFLSKK